MKRKPIGQTEDGEKLPEELNIPIADDDDVPKQDESKGKYSIILILIDS